MHPDIAATRADWKERQPSLNPGRLFFLAGSTRGHHLPAPWVNPAMTCRDSAR